MNYAPRKTLRTNKPSKTAIHCVKLCAPHSKAHIPRCFEVGTPVALVTGVATAQRKTGEIKMRVALAHNDFDAKHLMDVIAEMQNLGKPTIRVNHVERDLYQAIEGCHRLRAAAALGITPDFEYLDADTLRSDVDGLDYEDGMECDDNATIGSIGDWENISIYFED